MNRLIMKQKGSAPIWLWVISILLIIVDVIMLADSIETGEDDLIVSSLWALLLAIGSIVIACMYNMQFVDVYDDHIEGKGSIKKGGVANKSFRFAANQYTIAANGKDIVITSGQEVYYITTASAAVASQAVMNVLNPGAYQAVPPQYQQPMNNQGFGGFNTPLQNTVNQNFVPPVQPQTRPSQPVQQPVQQPVYQPVQQPVQPPVQQPIQPSVQQPIQPPVQQPIQPPVQQPIQPPVQQPVQQPVSQPKPTQATNSNSEVKKVRIHCASCGKYSKVPAGLGHIIATCPNCKNKIDITT